MILPFASYNLIMIAAAVIPALFLMIKVYKSDKLEPESPKLLFGLVLAGVASAFLALIEETVLEYALNIVLAKGTLLYDIILYFVVVALSEESSKYLLMKRKTWRNPEFDCRFDGIVYAAFTSLGFALWENISYVFSFGMSTALIRAFTAVPGHACFGIFMGVFYSIAKEYDLNGDHVKSSLYRKLAVIIPVLIHGAYDFIVSMNSDYATIFFFVFVILLFSVTFRLINKMSRNDRHMTWHILN